jgi:uncharacterized membrane protein (DUF4010 family)
MDTPSQFFETLPEGESGTTTVIAVLLCYGFGVMVWYGHTQNAVGLAIASTVLLHFKTELHGFSDRLAPGDISSMLQFAVLSFIVLPLLPNRGYGPYQVLNPHHLWLMVVLISGVSLAGYRFQIRHCADCGQPRFGATLRAFVCRLRGGLAIRCCFFLKVNS